MKIARESEFQIEEKDLEKFEGNHLQRNQRPLNVNVI